MRKVILLAQIIFTQSILFSQSLIYEDYDWDITPKLTLLSEADSQEPEIVLKDKSAIEFVYDKEGVLQAYSLTHKIIKVNSDKGIENNNKIYLPYSDASMVIIQKARVITSTGKIIKLNNSDIKEAKDEETESVYRYFALEGVDVGSEIEYIFYLFAVPSYYGVSKTLQSDIPKKNVEFELIAPSNLMFAAKSYNGLPEMQVDSGDADHNILSLFVSEIPALKEVTYANYDANLKRVIYKLDRNLYAKTANIVNYGDAAENIYNRTYTEISKSDAKKIGKFIEEMDLPKTSNDQEKILAIEQYIKTKFVLVSYNPEYRELATVLEKKGADEEGATRLFAAIFSNLGIDHQLVLTTNRYDIKFDPDFEAYNFLETYLIFFPKLNLYLAPGSQLSRLGFIPAGYTHNYGMFIKPVEVGDYKSGVSKIKFIDAVDYEKSQSNIYMDVQFSSDILNPVFNYKSELIGYEASGVQPYYDYFDIEEKKKVTEDQVKYISEEATISKVTIENEGTQNYPEKPFYIQATFKSSKFVEKAGEKYLFKIGELIGPQAEMYAEDNRVLEGEQAFNHMYHREIKFTLPDGYTCKNLDATNFDIFMESDDKRTAQFVSSYSVNGNQITVDIVEFYNKIVYPLSEFEKFRTVINAAADFNKVVLILEKK